MTIEISGTSFAERIAATAAMLHSAAMLALDVECRKWAWAALDGWGHTPDGGKFATYTLGERVANAEALASWLMFGWDAYDLADAFIAAQAEDR